MQELKDLGNITFRVFLLRIIQDYEDKKIDEEILAKILNIIVIYYVLRKINNLKDSGINTLMTSMYSRIFNNQNNEDYYESIYEFFMNELSDTDNKFPDIVDVSNKLKEINLFAKKNFCSYLLKAIENGRYKKVENSLITVNGKISIEHIMPQTLNND
ncbi:hypothetical protein IKS57_03325 [bacterium]|nr:hypothetical protein [bacterium]